MFTTLQRSWHQSLVSLIESAERRLTVVAPYIGIAGANLVSDSLSDSFRQAGRVDVITDLSPIHVADGSLELSAVIKLAESTASSQTWHVPRLHAKVYIADDSRAIVTSGNLTASAFYRNAEYGISIKCRDTIDTIQDHLDEYKYLGACVALDGLLDYASIASRVRETSERRQKTTDPSLSHALEEILRSDEDQLVRFRLAGGAMHTVFAKTIRYVLVKHGPLAKAEIHKIVQSTHPDLCDESIDRVIDGKSYGKKWKHAVRTAQQQLKRAGLVEYRDSVWKLRESGRA